MRKSQLKCKNLQYNQKALLFLSSDNDDQVLQLCLLTPLSLHQIESYEAGILFAKTEGIIPAPETTHAIAATIREAKKAKEEGKEKVILFNFSGHGLMDLTGYDKFLTGQLTDYELPQEEIDKNLELIKNYPKP